jgi:C1A family cysteine protease
MADTFTPRARGRVEPANLDHLIELSHERHGQRLRAIKKYFAGQFPTTYDIRTIAPAIVPALDETNDDQAQCGSCWCFSGTGVVEGALIKAGVLQPTQRLSTQYTLNCGQNGGCGGDDNTNVLDWAKKTGLPLTSQYGPYKGSASGRCTYVTSMPLYKIDDWGFADSNGGQGVTSTDDIKAAIVAYGMVGCAVAAGSDWDSAGPGVIIDGHSTGIDHDVKLVGWDDTKGTKGAWIMRNSWGPKWADGGYCLIEYGADSIGTETVFARVPSVVPTALDWLI